MGKRFHGGAGTLGTVFDHGFDEGRAAAPTEGAVVDDRRGAVNGVGAEVARHDVRSAVAVEIAHGQGSPPAVRPALPQRLRFEAVAAAVVPDDHLAPIGRGDEIGPAVGIDVGGDGRRDECGTGGQLLLDRRASDEAVGPAKLQPAAEAAATGVQSARPLRAMTSRYQKNESLGVRTCVW